MRVIICGSRTWGTAAPEMTPFEVSRVAQERDAVFRVVELLQPDDLVIHGAASGADTLASLYAKRRRDLRIQAHPAQWDLYGWRAGPIRNRAMLEIGKPDLVIYFTIDKDEPTTGTAHMVKIAKSAHVPVAYYRDYNGERYG